MQRTDLTGKTFGKLTVLSYSGRSSITYRDKWNCQCICGAIIEVFTRTVTSGKSSLCICKTIHASTHGHHSRTFRSKTYYSWDGMIQRCTNPKTAEYGRYGGRGITVCERWKSFKNFLADMGERPDNLTLERINNNLGYSKDNCKWATRKEQARNMGDRAYISKHIIGATTMSPI